MNSTANTSQFSEWTIAEENIPLPQYLLYFSGKFTDNQEVNLGIRLAQSHDLQLIEIERSQDAKKFEKIGEISINSTNRNQYQWTDKELDFENTDILYYRLVLKDNSNTPFYSYTIPVEVENKNSLIKIYPNPANGKINIESKLKIKKLEIFDAKGIYIKKIEIPESSREIDIRDLPARIYILRIVGETGFYFRKIVLE